MQTELSYDMVVIKIPIKHDDPQIHIVPIPSTSIQRSSKPVPLVRQAPVDLEAITPDNFVPWVCFHCQF